MKINRLLLITISIFFLISENGYSWVQKEKLWLALNVQKPLSADKKWLSFIYSQFRLINKSHPWQATLFEGGVGYQLLTNQSIWIGYRWTGENPNNGFYQENRLFQQLIWKMEKYHQKEMILRSRLEEIERTNESQIAVRLRERIALAFNDFLLFSNAHLFIYDEVFFQLNQTNYTSSKLISENRLFLGFNLFRKNDSWWEMGYINQIQMRTPLDKQNKMNHILSLTYNMH